jgi:hypothetical protein
MSDIGYRKKGDTGPFYNPERDYAYIAPELMCGAIDRFAAALDTFPEEQQWCTTHNISKEELAVAAQLFAQAQQDFINAAKPVASFDEALTRYGFKAIRFPVRQFLFATFGLMFCAAWFKAVRTVSMVGEESPAQDGIAQFSATVRAFANQCDVPPVTDTDIDTLWLQRDVLLAQVAKLQEENAVLRQRLRDLTPAAPSPTTWRQRFWNLFRKRGTNAQVQNVQRSDPVCRKTGAAG